MVSGGLVGLQGRDVSQHRARKLRTRNGKDIGVREQEPQPFVIDEEKRLVLDDGTAERIRPLIRVGEWRWRPLRIIERVVRVQEPSVPVIIGVAMELVGARFGYIRHLSSG